MGIETIGVVGAGQMGSGIAHVAASSGLNVVLTDIDAQIFRQLDGLCPEQTVLASNTSSISITKLAAITARPDRFIGMHFMNPVPMMKLLEVIRGLEPSD